MEQLAIAGELREGQSAGTVADGGASLKSHVR